MKLTLCTLTLVLLVVCGCGKNSSPDASNTGQPTADAYHQVKDEDGIRFYARSDSIGVRNGNVHAEGFQFGLIGKEGKEIPIVLVTTTVDQGEIQTRDFGILKTEINSGMQSKVFATETQIAKIRAFQSSQP